MKILNYSQKFETEVIKLWNDVLSWDLITANKFRKQILFDDNFNSQLSYVAIENGNVVGYILGTKRIFPYLERGLEPKRGWINVIFVHPNYERRGIGKSLISKVEEKLKELGAENITIGAYSPNYIFPGIDKENYKSGINFLNKLGYVAGNESYSMCKDLHSYELSEETIQKLKIAKEKGFSIIKFDYKYALETLEFVKSEFGGGWKRNLLISMQNNTAEDCVLLVLNKEENLVGFCMRMIDGNPMRFGPIGVAKAVRNYGIGGILFDIMQHEMKKQGIYHLYFISTDMPGRRFYERHGVKLLRTFVDYRKIL